ncbi:hypothetical protein AK830_g759 [Neonectria ditissima]|uniref:Major facilitator superfamily (MFS) profile domain-containing protein n=1 Tax=Neonectria ditissima TaxID=78410 RepID=A0A0P7BVG5_9HYPO|nr:hypothetical protein AK830_g759 [Neonectria ditissima]
MTDLIDHEKAHMEETEIGKPRHIDPNDLPLPDELVHLSRDEIHKLETRLTRRLDMTLMPTVFLLFLLNILDRNNIASAKIVGLQEDLGMTNNQYNTALMMFYIGYIITQIPSNMIIGKVRPSYYICLVTSLWGIVSMSQGFAKNYSQLYALRFVLGLVEAPFLPAVFVIMSCWYKRSELPPRIAILYGGNMMSAAFSGLIAAGITSRMDNVAGRASWSWLFIIEGAVTIVVAIMLVPVLTDYPLQSKHYFISRELQLVGEWRIRKENAGIVDEDPESIWWGLKQALIDPKLYMFIVLQMALITSQSFNNFFPSIVGTLGYGSTTTLLLTAPPYFFAFVVSLSISFHAGHKKERGWHIAVPLTFAVLGNILAMFVPSTGGRYFSMFLLTAGSYAPYSLCVSWLSASLPRPRAKRAAALAIVNVMAAGVAHFYTVYMFPDWQKPRYYIGGGMMAGACLVCGAMALYIKYYLKRQNKKLEEEETRGGFNYSHIIGSGRAGDDGGAVVSFRYVY